MYIAFFLSYCYKLHMTHIYEASYMTTCIWYIDVQFITHMWYLTYVHTYTHKGKNILRQIIQSKLKRDSYRNVILTDH